MLPAEIPAPPPAPRAISDSYAWRLLFLDAGGIVGVVFTFLGAIFTLLGTIFTLTFVLAFVGLPFLLFGLLFLAVGGTVLRRRHQHMSMVVKVLREGQATSGEIVKVEENMNVRVNHRHPWIIRYRFSLNGRTYEGDVSTLEPPGEALQPGQPACVLYLPDAPEHNALYPHP